jgi:predicted small secreted protein
MKSHYRSRQLSFAVAVLALLGSSVLLSACDAVAGAGEDVSATGSAVTNAAVQTQGTTRAP